MANQPVGIGCPVGLHPTGKISHRIRLDPGARDSEFLGLDEHCAGAAEGIENAIARAETEARQILTDEVRREGENEPIPFVYGAIFRVELIDFAVDLASTGRCITHWAPTHSTPNFFPLAS